MAKGAVSGVTTTRGKTMQRLRTLEAERLLKEEIRKNEEKQIDRPLSIHNGRRGNNHSHQKIPPIDI